ncbi:MAG: type II toxin-antitoxin system VapC family toxin [Candidatus Promineofilum sp.]|nr:type II toxin-antitoxin system VapC family toxin [Promineifilum sp.]
MILLDTDILIDVQRGVAPAVEWFSQLDELPAVPGFVVMELIQGANNAAQVRQVLKLVAPFAVIWPSDAECSQALSNFAIYRLSHGLGLLDALIAACAVGRSATLYSMNVKHYRAVPDLQVESPYQRHPSRG